MAPSLARSILLVMLAAAGCKSGTSPGPETDAITDDGLAYWPAATWRTASPAAAAREWIA